ncbi:MAG TPA: hypothetical protein VEK06_05285 [Myxococcota bacterium]|nr:hypothetical protein [Myxococcota bacterium]
MKKILICQAFVAVVFLSGANSCEKSEGKEIEAHAKSENIKAELKASCREDEDCTTIKKDCCGCRQGGSQRAIVKDQVEKAKEELKTRCSGVMCIQAISTDDSCTKNSLCKSGNCVLE